MIPAWPGILHIIYIHAAALHSLRVATMLTLASQYSTLPTYPCWLPLFCNTSRCSLVTSDLLPSPRRGESPPLLCGFTGPRTKEPTQRNPRYVCSGRISMLISGHHPWVTVLYILYRSPNTRLHDIAELLVVLRVVGTNNPADTKICNY